MWKLLHSFRLWTLSSALPGFITSCGWRALQSPETLEFNFGELELIEFLQVTGHRSASAPLLSFWTMMSTFLERNVSWICLTERGWTATKTHCRANCCKRGTGVYSVNILCLFDTFSSKTVKHLSLLTCHLAQGSVCVQSVKPSCCTASLTMWFMFVLGTKDSWFSLGNVHWFET